jgi:hypothetical protein
MHLKRVRIPNFRVLQDVDITFEPDLVPRIFPLGSINGGGKSTLLQLIFTLLHCCSDEQRIPYLQNMLDGFDIEDESGYRDLATIDLVVDGQDLELKFFLGDWEYIDNNLEDDINIHDRSPTGNIGSLKERDDSTILATEIDEIFGQVNDLSDKLSSSYSRYLQDHNEIGIQIRKPIILENTRYALTKI